MGSNSEQRTPSNSKDASKTSQLWPRSGSEDSKSKMPLYRRVSRLKSYRAKPVETKGSELEPGTDLSGQIVTAQPSNNLTPGDDAAQDKRLLGLSDDVRLSLRKHKGIGKRRDELMGVLGAAVRYECDGALAIGIQTIRKSHLDKLLQDMLNPENHPNPMPIELRADLKVAESLQRQWKTRFRDSYLFLDQARYKLLRDEGGRLEKVYFDATDPDQLDFWKAKKTKRLSQRDIKGGFEEGYWWPNVACAHADGIVGTSRQVLSQAEFDMPTLPLLSGAERISFSGDETTYTREGGPGDMSIPLMTFVGQYIRILRGSLLQSTVAPLCGVRYDGV